MILRVLADLTLSYSGPVGGFGWMLSLNGGAPKELRISMIEVLPGHPLLISVQYPVGTELSVTISYPQDNRAGVWSRDAACQNAAHHYDTTTGVLTVRAVGPTDQFFTRNGLSLPRSNGNNVVTIKADCPSSDGVYCTDATTPVSITPCPTDYEQTAYDKCCHTSDATNCKDIAEIYAVAPSPTPSTDNLLSDPDFEGECGGRPWYAEGSATVLTIDRSDSASGVQSMKVTGRANSWNGVRQDVTGKFLPGNSYRVRFFCRFLGGPANLALKLIVYRPSATNYIGHQGEIPTTWTLKNWLYNIPDDAVRVILYVETPGNTDDFAVDGFTASLEA